MLFRSHDTIRLRTEAGPGALDGLDGIEEINDQGNHQEVRWRGDPQELLAALMGRTRILQFEIARPSLRDIFVRIAAPEDEPKPTSAPEAIAHAS